MSEHFSARSHEEMKEVLMNPEASGPETHYYMVRGDAEEHNITVWESGDVGGEYIKTLGHYHVGDIDETYWVLFGRGIALLQKRAVVDGVPQQDVIEEFRVVHINQGDMLYVPPHFGHCLVNTGPSFLVTADNNAQNNVDAGAPPMNDYKPIGAMRGFLYYVVNEGGEPVLKRNDTYREVQQEDLGGLRVI